MTFEARVDMLTTFDKQLGAFLADPSWQFQNRNGEVASEHKRLNCYVMMTLDDIRTLSVADS